MATGSAWNVSNPLKPVALFDPNAVRDIPFEWDLWLTDIGSYYQSHTVVVGAGLTCPSSSQALGVIKVRIQKDPALPLVVGTKYPVTCRIVAANGEIDDQTVWLKITEK